MADTFAKYHCNYCEEDINGLRVRCIECEDFDLCLQCFACGAQIGKHKAYHGYQFMDTGNFSVFPGQGSWTAREEVRLLDAIEQYGYGNWDDIAKHIESKTSEEAKQKYISSYIDGTIGKATWREAQESIKNLPIENMTTDAGPLSPTLGSSLQSAPLTFEETSILGYMVNRDDFEREYDNEAETTISPLFIHPVDDDEIDVALKLSQVDMYIRRLRERSRRKRVVRDFNLANQFFKKEKEKLLQHPLRKKQKDDKELLADKLRPISQFQTAKEHQNLINSMARERELRVRIKELLRYRRNGIRHIEECIEFEVAKSRRDKKKENKKKTRLLQILTNPVDNHARLEKDGKNQKCSAEKKFTALDTGDGKWLNVNSNDKNYSPNNQWQSMVNDDPVEISTLPSYHLLSVRERKLCASLNMKPSQYISFKAFKMREEGEKLLGGKISNNTSTFVGLDARSQIHITNFIAKAGWISLKT